MPEKPASNMITEPPCTGAIFDVTGRSPFFLDGAENLWVVLDGQIDVLSLEVRLTAGQDFDEFGLGHLRLGSAYS